MARFGAATEDPHFSKCAASRAPASKMAVTEESDFEDVGIKGVVSETVAELAAHLASSLATGLEFKFDTLRLGLEPATRLGAVTAPNLKPMFAPDSVPTLRSTFGFVSAAAD